MVFCYQNCSDLLWEIVHWIPRKIQVHNMLCTKIVFCFDIQNNICTQHVVNLYDPWNSLNNVSSYCGLTGARMRASEKDLPVLNLGRLCSARKNFSSVIPEAFCQHTRLTSYIFVLKCVNAWEKTYNSFSLTFFLRRVKD